MWSHQHDLEITDVPVGTQLGVNLRVWEAWMCFRIQGPVLLRHVDGCSQSSAPRVNTSAPPLMTQWHNQVLIDSKWDHMWSYHVVVKLIDATENFQNHSWRFLFDTWSDQRIISLYSVMSDHIEVNWIQIISLWLSGMFDMLKVISHL